MPFAHYSEAQYSCNIYNFEKNRFYDNFKYYYDSDTNIDVKYYKILLDIRTNPNYLYGETTANGLIINTADTIFFDFSNVMFVDSVRYNGNIVDFNHYKNKITIYSGANSLKKVVFP